jgi:hypothetical protein
MNHQFPTLVDFPRQTEQHIDQLPHMITRLMRAEGYAKSFRVQNRLLLHIEFRHTMSSISNYSVLGVDEAQDQPPDLTTDL